VNQRNKVVVVAVALGLVVAGAYWFSGSPTKAYGVWRVVGPANIDDAQAKMAQNVMSEMGVGMFFEFAATSCTVHAATAERAVSNTGKWEWTARACGGKLYCRDRGGKSEIIITVVDHNTLILESPDSRAKHGMKLKRSSASELEAAMQDAGQ